ncbi:uncharacterized protein LOC126379558 isoform X3 [Pectinophora gossypiella]|uniref:uncharacterized protein LOC126379558 isoform X3 n=1 Tax=Pectinophora gossypiella TaxID=13191 RepID=UPI00214EBA6C|nr:uncharacterized protein LOC126379558 isoform X3 [Pectinophora gossypiella]
MLILLLISSPILTSALPFALETTLTTTDLPEELQKDINIVSYIQNFKLAMTEYVTSQYKNLTIQETEKVKDILEQFLTNFANDLKEAIERQYQSGKEELEYDKIDDGIPDETFQDIDLRVRTEFPDINENTAREIVYRLRKNLFETRQKLDIVIRDSLRAQLDIAAD